MCGGREIISIKNASLLGSLKSGFTSLLGEPHYHGDKDVSCVCVSGGWQSGIMSIKNASLLSSLKSGSTSHLGEPHYEWDKEVSCVGGG